jgi:hypothetical protein
MSNKSINPHDLMLDKWSYFFKFRPIKFLVDLEEDTSEIISPDLAKIWLDTGYDSDLGNDLEILSTDGTGSVYRGGSYLYKSIDYGLTWTTSSIPLDGTYLEWIRYMGNNILLGLIDRDDAEYYHLVRSADGGANWTSLGMIDPEWVDDVVDAGNGIYVAYTPTPPDGLYRSTDYGLTWSEKIDTKVRTNKVYNNGNGVLFVWDAGNLIISKSIDSGETWTQLSQLGVIELVCMQNSTVIVNRGNVEGGWLLKKSVDNYETTEDILLTLSPFILAQWLVNGVAISVDGYRSTNYFGNIDTYTLGSYVPGDFQIYKSIYLGNNICLGIDANSNIFRSTVE